MNIKKWRFQIYETAKRTILVAPPQKIVGFMVNDTVSCFDGLETIGAVVNIKNFLGGRVRYCQDWMSRSHVLHN